MATIKTIQRTIAFLGGLSAVGNITTLGTLSAGNGSSTQWNNVWTTVNANSGAWSAGGGGGGGAADWTYIANKPTTLAGYGITDAAPSSLTTVVASNSSTWGDKSFSSITGKPTTLAGYGITDATSSGLTTFVSANSSTWADKAFSSITGTPTTLAGYGITDAASSTLTTLVASNSATWGAPSFASITSKPTTLAEYGITDAASSSLTTLVQNNSSTWSDQYWSSIMGKPTTLAGYGITDAASTSYVNSTFIPASGGTITGSLSVLGNLTYIDTSVAVTSAMYIDTASSETALRVTQSGPGDAIRVEDSTNPDTTPFIVKSDGLVGIGTADPNEKLTVVGNVSATAYYGSGSNLTGVAPSSLTTVVASNSATWDDKTFASITNKPTTLAGYGITDSVVVTTTTYTNPSWISTLAWSKLTGTPTTLAGYGITDAASSSVTTSVSTNSGNWNTVYTSVNTNSASWTNATSWTQSNSANPTFTSTNSNAYKGTSSTTNTQTGTSYTIQASDNGKVITFNNSNAIGVIVPSGLGAGFSCMLIQIGTGQVTITDSGVTLNSYLNYNKLAGQHAGASLYAYTADVFNLNGALSA